MSLAEHWKTFESERNWPGTQDLVLPHLNLWQYIAFEMFSSNCMNLVQWFAQSDQTPPPPKRKREEEIDLQAVKKQMLTQLNEMIENCKDLDELKRKLDKQK